MNNDGISDYYDVGIAAADNGVDDTDSKSDTYDVDIAGSGHTYCLYFIQIIYLILSLNFLINQMAKNPFLTMKLMESQPMKKMAERKSRIT